MLKLKEVDYQSIFHNKYRSAVQREVKTPIGIIDFIWTTPGSQKIIEFKHYKSIKHAIGQLLSYRVYRPDIKHLEVVYFDYNPSNNTKIAHLEQGFYKLATQYLLDSQVRITFSNILHYLTTQEITDYYYSYLHHSSSNTDDNHSTPTFIPNTVPNTISNVLCVDTENIEKNSIDILDLMQTPDWMSI